MTNTTNGTVQKDHPAPETALRRAREALLTLQKEDGHWCGELEGDSILASEYILMKFILGQERQPMANGDDGWETLQKIGRTLKILQREDGGWGQFPGSGVDLSATVKAYYALKLLGEPPESEGMRNARRIIRASGGAERVNTFSNFYLACLGQTPWSSVPAIPPEIMLLPSWSFFHLRKLSAWTRTMVVPLSLVVTLRPLRKPACDIDELYLSPVERKKLSTTVPAPRGWRFAFQAVDRILKLLHPLGGTPLRRIAIRKAEQWLLERATSGGLGAIFPPMVYLQIALHALGYPREHAVRQRAERELDALFIEENDAIRIQPCFSPVWDTGIALYALADAGMDEHDQAVQQAAAWLRQKECRVRGDWVENLPGASSSQDPNSGGGGWWFEFDNSWYPDVDDTAMVAMALKRAGGKDNEAAAARGVVWMLAMQNDDGGWAAFDKTKHHQILEYIPFADHNAMQDPSCPDITGRVLECLAGQGFDLGHPVVQRAVGYIREKQDGGTGGVPGVGGWFGRWGVNYLYGTWQAVIGPLRCGVSRDEPWIQEAGRWVKSVQKPDGSFGESADSYDDPLLIGRGPSTASQTAWAAMTLQEIFGPNDPDLARAIQWLCQTQLSSPDASDPGKNPDGDPPGSWVEPQFTGTGFPKVFYLRYHLYRLYFPLMAMARFVRAQRGSRMGSIVSEGRVKMPPKVGIGV